MPSQDPDLSLDYQLCFAVYSTSNAFVRAYNQLLEKVGLSYPGYLVMLAVWEKDCQSPADIAARLHLPENGVEPVLRQLAAKGYIHRRRSREKNGAEEIFVTPAGLALKEDVRRVRGNIGCMVALDDEKMQALRQDLLRVRNAIEKELEALKPRKNIAFV